MKGSNTTGQRFPLEPLHGVRAIRTRALEMELQRCRRLHAEADARREQAAACLRQACAERQDYCVTTWRRLFVGGAPTGLATTRYKKHLALLDQHIDGHQAALQACEKEVAEALQVVEAAAATWRQAYRKLDAVERMKQDWTREARQRSDMHDEQAAEELFTNHAPVI